MKPRILFVAILFCLSTLVAIAQKQVRHRDQVWIGYMTSAKLNAAYSLWNDVHYVPGSFAIARTGLTRSVFGGGSVTGGYAFLLLAMGPDEELRRPEHRPWGQLQFTLPAGNSWSLTQRVRYDARFRRNVFDGEVTDGFMFNHRVRFLVSLRKNIGLPRNGLQPYGALSNETLLNFGKEVMSNTFDQNRLSLSFGVQRGNMQYQIGFMNRFVQNNPSSYTLNHTVVFWVIQKFDLGKILSHHESPDILSE